MVALIPVLICVWALPTANVLELFLMDEHTVCIWTATGTFGLPVRQISCFLYINEIEVDRTIR